MAGFGIYGAGGRMGRLLIDYLALNAEHTLSSVLVRKGIDLSLPPETLVTNDPRAFLESAEVVVDFSSPKGTEALLETAIAGVKPKALVVGTTGLDPHQQNLLKDAAEKLPVLYATNMSLGIALLNKLVFEASKALADFDIEILEMHHRFKKDAPSGTALALAATAAKARDADLDSVRVSGRNGAIGERSSSEIGVMSLRGGDLVGEHTVGFYGDGEFIRIAHVATNRTTFAAGAVKAGSWLLRQPNGLYSIQDYFQL
ncbi:MAG: 4-hydroxy-tetrahydrodipicolinate reductase [Helicobacteraceae bacterium]|jgi:4-hydroxy-tetrahydrodipicolinate reductase|nr:4-hydroxy-tetrahydrodipicolinate reductase [Helicobacteraceae bacterium]